MDLNIDQIRRLVANDQYKDRSKLELELSDAKRELDILKKNNADLFHPQGGEREMLLNRFGPVGSGACDHLSPFIGLNKDYEICDLQLYIDNREQDLIKVNNNEGERLLVYKLMSILKLSAYVLYISVAIATLLIMILLLSLRVFGSANIIAPLFMDYSVETVPYGAQNLVHP